MTVHESLLRLRDERQARIYVAASGGGAGIQGHLASIPGSSAFLIGAEFPYATEAVDRFLGFRSDQYCSEEAAVDMASEAFMRAGGEAGSVGIGVAACIATTKEHRGDHRVHAAWLSERGCFVHSAVLEKGHGFAQRQHDGRLADAVGLNALFDAMELGSQSVDVRHYEIKDAGGLARRRFFEHPHFRSNGTRDAHPESLAATFPGAFNPPHPGHFGMAEAFRAESGLSPTFWIEAAPPHKAALPVHELLQRAAWLRGRDVLFTEGAALYADKARMFPGSRFLIGADAMLRLLDPKWGPDLDELAKTFERHGTRFYVANRALEGELRGAADVPEPLASMCVVIPGRWDISSTEIREGKRAK